MAGQWAASKRTAGINQSFATLYSVHPSCPWGKVCRASTVYRQSTHACIDVYDLSIVQFLHGRYLFVFACTSGSIWLLVFVLILGVYDLVLKTGLAYTAAFSLLQTICTERLQPVNAFGYSLIQGITEQLSGMHVDFHENVLGYSSVKRIKSSSHFVEKEDRSIVSTQGEQGTSLLEVQC